MRSLFRIFSLSPICFLLIASNDAAVNTYGYRGGRSLAATQGTSVVSVNPRAYQTPWGGGVAVSSPSNMGHGSTTSSTSINNANGSNSQTKTCLWTAFQNVSGVKTRATLKFDWFFEGSVEAGVGDSTGYGWAQARIDINYSTDNGSSWSSAMQPQDVVVTAYDGESDNDSLWIGGSESIDLSNPSSIDISRIRVEDNISAQVETSAPAPTGNFAYASATVTISNIRLEVETLNCPASVPTDRWRGEYFNNINLSGIPTTVRDDGAGFLNFNFGDDPPAGTCGLPGDNFSARWTRTINFSRGVYRFTVTADDGVRLYVDGQMKIDAWVLQGPTTYTADVFLTTGNHEIKLEYFEYTGGALISLNWTTLVNCVASVPADRWKGEYYSNTTLTGSPEPEMVRDDGNGFLDFNFGEGGSGSVCAPAVDNFSVRWTRTVNFAAGTYRFIVTADDGVRLYVDGQLKIDAWVLQGPTTYTADVFLIAGNHEIKLEYFEYTVGAVISLFWGDVNCLANVPAGRWRGEYYNNTTTPTGFPAMVRDDGAGFLNFDFGLGSPSAACGIGADNFSARWTRTVNFAATTYRFSVTGDDGVRLYVDGQLKIDKWFGQGATTYMADVALSAGNHEVKLEYFESGGPGVAFLSWADVTGVNCLPNMPLPLISSVPQAGGRENIASTAPSQAPKRCGQKNSD